ncbi:hypothetical protein ACNFJ7_16000 [Sphingomonas sp. HT-1]|uniref:hypothetical protein n=1 Tax=unclassified Sphingomonas TaxID=196159 RepID=UPI00030B2315|nr:MULTISPECIES: hypothetical protein [unclassified Sphingomonas]KTF68137.1 hypothetical protein ATB93_15275 [Sphingomonas sp. WG]
MKKFMLLIAGLGVAAAAVPASAAPAFQGGWQNINARQDRLEQRINQGIRSGALSRREATRIRNEYRGLVRLEARYRASRPGLTMQERRDLDRRYDVLSAKVRYEKQDRNRRRG